MHPSPYSGSWYPARPSDLETLLAAASEKSRRRTGPFLPPDALAYVVPHAGPAYSGVVASAVYRAIEQQRPERIVVLAFPHHGGLRGVASPEVEAISTPLGRVEIDPALGFPRVPEEEVCDHSFEIQLPFLQRAAPAARVAPLYIGRMTAAERRAAADRLAAAWEPGTVFLASSDFTHYGPDFGFVPFPASHDTGDLLRDLDEESIEAASSLDAELFLETLRENGSTVCGTGPIALLLDILQRLGGGGIYQAELDYQTSGEITGDFRHSVSYAALGYYRRQAFELPEPDHAALLDSAEETLRRLRATGVRRPVPARGGSAALQARCGAFVSLHRGDELLGCIGNCWRKLPLAQHVPELVLAAALDDPRFRPAVKTQGPIDIEISVLTPFRRVRGVEGFQLGKHGALLRLAGRTGLLLPQVAAGYEWTAEEFWQHTARKCMLGRHAWRDPQARLFVFEAQVLARAAAAEA